MDHLSVEAPAGGKERMERLAAIVSQHVRQYAEVGAALKELRDAQLYRITHRTWADFISARWEMSESHATRLIAASDVARNVAPVGVVPKTERLARPLTQLAPNEQRQAWQEAVSLADGNQVTPSHVASAVDRRKPAKKHKRPKSIRLRVPGALIAIEPTRAFVSVEQCLVHALEQIRSSRAA